VQNGPLTRFKCSGASCTGCESRISAVFNYANVLPSSGCGFDLLLHLRIVLDSDKATTIVGGMYLLSILSVGYKEYHSFFTQPLSESRDLAMSGLWQNQTPALMISFYAR
jgi:hypothetical protein